MARGYPDYFGQSIWPKYGGMVNDNDSFDVVGPTTEILTTYSGQGVLVFLDLDCVSLGSLESAVLEVHVDGVPIQIVSFEGFRMRGPWAGERAPLVCRYYDLTEFEMVIGLGQEIPFRTSFSIELAVADGDEVTVETFVGYYAVS